MDSILFGLEERFAAFAEGMAEAIGNPKRRRPLRDYLRGLTMPLPRKSVEPLAAATDPTRVSAQHQSLLHFVTHSEWSDEDALDYVRNTVLPKMLERGPVRACIVDDTSFPKQGKHSVGVQHQYCGQLGKQENCQVAVSLSLATDAASLPVAWQLYMPQVWIDDSERREKAGVPDDVVFRTKPQIALDQIREAKKKGVPLGVVLADAGYGDVPEFRAGLTKMKLRYAVGVKGRTTVWRPGEKPAKAGSRPKGFKPAAKPVSALELAKSLPADAWRTVAWREGTNETLSSRFAAVRVRPAGEEGRTRALPRLWLLAEWPPGEETPTKFVLSTMLASASVEDLVDVATMRWRIERDYQDLKQEFGLGDFEGRMWRGFHHHATLCIAVYAFLVSLRGAFSPSAHADDGGAALAALRAAVGPPADFPEAERLRRAATAPRKARRRVDGVAPRRPRGRPRKNPLPLSMLHPSDGAAAGESSAEKPPKRNI